MIDQDLLKAYAADIGVELYDTQLAQFDRYAELLCEWNEKMNLTGITDPYGIVIRHFVDSLTLVPFLKDGATLIDVGTGAGFPAIPAAIARPALIGEIADRFGAQVLVLSLDVKRAPTTASGFVVTTHGGRTETTLDALDWAREAIERGAGELLVNSIDADGTRDGFDLELVRLMREVSSVPVIASGGAGAAADFAPAIKHSPIKEFPGRTVSSELMSGRKW